MTGGLTACAGSCGPGSLHFINGLFESHRNRAPVVLIASQVNSNELGIDFPAGGRLHPHLSQLQRLLRVAQPTRARRGGSPPSPPRRPYPARRGGPDRARRHQRRGGRGRARPTACTFPPRSIRPSDAELDRIAAILNDGGRIAVYAGVGCQGALEQVVRFCETVEGADGPHIPGQGLRRGRQPLQRRHDRRLRLQGRLRCGHSSATPSSCSAAILPGGSSIPRMRG